MFELLLALVFIRKSYQQDISAVADLKTLTELPLDKLLKLKHDFDWGGDFVNVKAPEAVSTPVNGPEALALQSKPLNRGGGYDHYYEKKGHKKDSSSIFQLSVTTLSFAAFGGYLLCLIVQAIRAKHAATTTTAAPAPAAIFRPIRHHHRIGSLQHVDGNRNPRPTTSNRYKRGVKADWDPDVMYDALISIAEGYSKYHTIDYKKFNSTNHRYFS